LAAFAGQLHVLDAEFLLGNHRRAKYRCPVMAVWARTRAVLRPERVDDFRAFVAVMLPLLGWQRGRIDLGLRVRPKIDPLASVTARTLGHVVWLDLWLDLGLDPVEELLDLAGISAGEFVLGDKPRDGVEVHARHLKTEPGAFD